MSSRSLLLPFLVVGLSIGASTGCSGESSEGADDPLTSVTGRSRSLKTESVVYVEAGSSNAAILARVQEQNRSLFGALLTKEIGVNNRELKAVDPKKFKIREVTLLGGSFGPKKMKEIRYVYEDQAVVPKEMAQQSVLPLAMLGSGINDAKLMATVKDCSKNDKEAQDDARAGFFWYTFNPSLASCKKAISTEAAKIEASRKTLKAGKTDVVPEEVNRVLVPATVSLGVDETNKKAAYPEYDQLFFRGIEPGRLKMGLLFGRIEHDFVRAGEDQGFGEYLSAIDVLLFEHEGMKFVKLDNGNTLSEIKIGFGASGRTVANPTFADMSKWVNEGKFPSGFTTADKKALVMATGDLLDGHWATFEIPKTVTINGTSKPVVVQIDAYFGVESEIGPYKKGLKEHDIFLYSGHSYIGRGPLDPKNFTSSDFPSSYQILFFDGCVSYNYYEKDYFSFKSGGSKSLDIVTNALESPAYLGGYAGARFLSTLLRGGSYEEMLVAAKDTDSLRVVNGELDNKFDPKASKLLIE